MTFTDSGLAQRIEVLEGLKESLRREIEAAHAEEARAQRSLLDKRAIMGLLEDNLQDCYEESQRRQEVNGH